HAPADRDLRTGCGDQPCRTRTHSFQQIDELVHANHIALEVEDEGSLSGGEQALDEGLRYIADVLQVHIARKADLKRLPESHCLHSQRRVSGEATIAPDSVDRPGTQADARDTVGLKKDSGVAFVGLLEDAVMRGRLERILFGELAGA